MHLGLSYYLSIAFPTVYVARELFDEVEQLLGSGRPTASLLIRAKPTVRSLSIIFVAIPSDYPSR